VRDSSGIGFEVLCTSGASWDKCGFRLRCSRTQLFMSWHNTPEFVDAVGTIDCSDLCRRHPAAKNVLFDERIITWRYSYYIYKFVYRKPQIVAQRKTPLRKIELSWVYTDQLDSTVSILTRDWRKFLTQVAQHFLPPVLTFIVERYQLPQSDYCWMSSLWL
jgi:hypothetical protein